MRNYHKDGTMPTGDKWIWVFGSNLAGRHGAGAAKVAFNNFGAVYGKGSGPTGRSYAIPTKDEKLRVIELVEIEKSVKIFIDYATKNPCLNFFVTRIGCGYAGYTDNQIAPYFKYAPNNCSLPAEWMK